MTDPDSSSQHDILDEVSELISDLDDVVDELQLHSEDELSGDGELDPEVLEFLKLVEQARSEAGLESSHFGNEEEPAEPTEEPSETETAGAEQASAPEEAGVTADSSHGEETATPEVDEEKPAEPEQPVSEETAVGLTEEIPTSKPADVETGQASVSEEAEAAADSSHGEESGVAPEDAEEEPTEPEQSVSDETDPVEPIEETSLSEPADVEVGPASVPEEAKATADSSRGEERATPELDEEKPAEPEQSVSEEAAVELSEEPSETETVGVEAGQASVSEEAGARAEDTGPGEEPGRVSPEVAGEESADEETLVVEGQAEVMAFLQLVEEAKAEAEPVKPEPDLPLGAETVKIKVQTESEAALETFRTESKPSKESESLIEGQKTGVPPRVLDEKMLELLQGVPKKPKKEKIGEGLRNLEELLSKTSTSALPDGQKKRARAALRFLKELGKVQRAMVVTLHDNQQFQVVAVGGIDGDYLAQAPERLLRRVLSGGKPLLLLDATQDRVFAREPAIVEHQIRSVLCVPFKDLVTGQQGLLYADNLEQSGAFTYGHLNDVVEFAGRLSTEAELEEFELLRPPEPQELQSEAEPLSLATVGGIMMFLLLCVVLVVTGPTIREAPSTDTVGFVSAKASRPEEIARSFIQAIRLKRFPLAYSLLSPALKRKWSQQAFSDQVGGWLEQPGHTVGLGYRHPLPVVSSKSERITVTVEPGKKHPGTSWRWELVKAEEGWRIEAMTGGPLSP